MGNLVVVKDFKKVNTTHFKEGQTFKMGNRLAILLNGKLQEIYLQKPLTKTQVTNIVKEQLKGEK